MLLQTASAVFSPGFEGYKILSAASSYLDHAQLNLAWDSLFTHTCSRVKLFFFFLPKPILEPRQ